ncbi:hypothetical protein ACFFLS_04870 [Flavobacterium procerum]|uniref:Lipoprotein n=1 Tax=Flavobacterium procerum TaxID=1455569 RepID=A0ABV6BLP5_9FLAO
MKRLYNTLFFISFFGLFVNCSSSTEKKTEQKVSTIQTETDKNSKTPQSTNGSTAVDDNKIIKRYTEKEILNLIVGNYINDDEGTFHCKFNLRFNNRDGKLKYHIKTEKRKISGIAKIKIVEDGFIYIIFPIEWDDYQGDMTQDTYEKYTGEKPQEVGMLFDVESKTLNFQNFGNAMNNYIIFDECDEKGINLKCEKSNH